MKKYSFLYWIAAICVLYGVKVFLAGSGTLFFAVWIVIGACFALIPYCIRKNIWKKIPVMFRTGICVLLSLGILIFAVIEGLIMTRFFDRGEDGMDYIVVLGAQVYEDGPSPILKIRLDRAADYLEENPGTICVVSGGQGYNEPFPEAVGMAAYLQQKGIAPERILLEKTSDNTAENLQNSLQLIPEDAKVGIVTNNFHVFRALKTAERVGYRHCDGIAAGCPLGFIPNNLLREFFGVIKFMLS